MHTLHAWFTVVVHYPCTACDQLPPAACVTCLDEYTDAVSIYKINVVYKKNNYSYFSKTQIADAGDADAIVDATRQFCQNSCVSDCDDEPTFAGAKAGIYSV